MKRRTGHCSTGQIGLSRIAAQRGARPERCYRKARYCHRVEVRRASLSAVERRVASEMTPRANGGRLELQWQARRHGPSAPCRRPGGDRLSLQSHEVPVDVDLGCGPCRRRTATTTTVQPACQALASSTLAGMEGIGEWRASSALLLRERGCNGLLESGLPVGMRPVPIGGGVLDQPLGWRAASRRIKAPTTWTASQASSRVAPDSALWVSPSSPRSEATQSTSFRS